MFGSFGNNKILFFVYDFEFCYFLLTRFECKCAWERTRTQTHTAFYLHTYTEPEEQKIIIIIYFSKWEWKWFCKYRSGGIGRVSWDFGIGALIEKE